jgi:hypothetical protein
MLTPQIPANEVLAEIDSGDLYQKLSVTKRNYAKVLEITSNWG